MAHRVEVFALSAPAGTLPSAPVERLMTFAPGEVELLEIDLPPGHAGFTGLQIAQAHQPILPRTVGAWLTGDGQTFKFETHGYLNNGYWSAFLYNQDTNVHTWTVTFHIREIETRRRGLVHPDGRSMLDAVQQALDRVLA